MKLSILLSLFLFSIVLPIHGQNSWRNRAELPVRRYQAVAFSIGKYGYVGTGIGRNTVCLNDFWRYDPETDTWMQMESMPTTGRAAANCFVINNKGYVACGWDGFPDTYGEFWEYNPEFNKWTRKADFPPPLHCCQEWMDSFAFGGKGYIWVDITQILYRYDPLNDTWTRLPDTDIPFATQRVSFSTGGNAFVGLGFRDTNFVSEFYKFDPVKESWSRVADFPGLGRVDAVGFSIGNHGYVGLGHKGTKYLHDFWEYHPDTDSWNQIDSLNYEVDFAVGMNIGSKGFVGTGFSVVVHSQFWEYTPQISSGIEVQQSEPPRIFPNPVDDHLFLDMVNRSEVRFAIYTVLGQLVKSGTIKGSSIGVDDLGAGIYLIKIFMKDRIISQKFIKR